MNCSNPSTATGITFLQSSMVGKTAAEKVKDYKIEGWGKAIGMAFNNYKTQLIKILDGFYF